jgi:hypothetical protein
MIPFTPEQASVMAATAASEMLAHSIAANGSPFDQAILRARIEMHRAAARYHFIVAELKASERPDNAADFAQRHAPQREPHMRQCDPIPEHGSGD